MRRALTVIVMLLAAGCGDDDRPTSPFPSSATQATSPTEALFLLGTALESRNVVQYDSLLARDYTFLFTPEDVADDTLDAPASWGYADEMQAMRRLLRSDNVEEIKVAFELNPMEESEVAGADAMITIYNIFIEVTTRLPSGEPLFLQATGTSHLHFKEQPWTNRHGVHVWQVIQWDDLTLPLTGSRGGDKAATETTTWGRIKLAFH